MGGTAPEGRVTVRLHDSAAAVLAEAGTFLEREPVLHNVILTLLHNRAAHPEPGRYAVAHDADGAPVGVLFQSPLHFLATITPMADDVVAAVVDALVEAGVRLPGVNGVAATVARFAGQWAERTKSPVVPVQGQRLYEVTDVRVPEGVAGACRPAAQDDLGLLVEWFEEFGVEAGEVLSDPDVVQRRLGAGHLWFWQHDVPVSFAGLSDTRAGVARIGPVYTPLERRERGYAAALTAELSRIVLDRGERCILYTDLANPVSNSVYRRIGYRAVAEVLRYDFGTAGVRE